MQIDDNVRQHAKALLEFIDHSPSPWHAVANVATTLRAHGFKGLREYEPWQFKASGKYFVVRDDGAIVAFILGSAPLVDTGFRVVGAHTDSPGLRLKPNAAFASHGVAQLGVEVYGGPILATFTDRDLSLAGRVTVKEGEQIMTRLVKFDHAIARIPNLAIHMNREVNEKGLVLNKQTGLPLIFGMAADSQAAKALLLEALATQLAVPAAHILAWDLAFYDTQPGAFWGLDQDFIANSQLDNLASCHAALSALIATEKPTATVICALLDHEEVGSESATGAAGSFLLDVIQRICLSTQTSTEGQLQAFAKSFFISADMAHAFHPNHAGSYEPCHHVQVNQGPVIKTNANQRYSTNAVTASCFMALCDLAKVPYQHYVHRTDLGCGSTIGPILAAQLGMATVDVGNPMWAMHSLRESAGVLDHHYLTQVLTAHFASA